MFRGGRMFSFRSGGICGGLEGCSMEMAMEDVFLGEVVERGEACSWREA